MSFLCSSTRRFPPWLTVLAVAITVAVLSGCGFEPLYGRGSPTGSIAPQLQNIKISNIPDRRGQVLRNLLIDQFYTDGRPADPVYRLDVSLGVNRQSLGIAKDDTATRAQLIVSAQYELFDLKALKPFFRGSSRTVANYNIQTAPFANLVSEQEALDRGLRQVSEDITNRVAIALRRDP